MANLMLLGLIVQSAFIGTVAWIIRRQCFKYANFSYVKENEVLQGSIIATLPGKSTAECEAECVKEYRCKSINIQIAGQRNCELNSENVVDKMANLTLTSKAGWTYKATNYNETLVGVNCKYFKPCAVNHVCVDSCDCPGYICYRCRGINIGINCLANFVFEGEALGMESKKITDSQISASSITAGHQDQRHSRLNLYNAWCAKVDRQNIHQWIKVDLIRRKIITDVAVQSYKDTNLMVRSYQLQYSEDDISWQTYEEDGIIREFVGPTAQNEVKKESLVYYIQAYAVKINPRTKQGHMCLRMELYGIDDPWQPVPQECMSSSYKILNNADRHMSQKMGVFCDSGLSGWYRFMGAAGTMMPTSCVTKIYCSTHAAGWLNGAHPSVLEGVVTRTVCFSFKGCCWQQTDISVRNCGSFYVYKLKPPPGCSYRYCGTN